MAKFFVEASAITGEHIYLEDKEDVKHLTRVLRAREGDKVEISDCVAFEYVAQIEDINPDCVTLKIMEKRSFETEPKTRVTLYQGVPKASKMETIIQKTVEMGVDAIVPVFMERTVVVEKGGFSKKLERWQKIADEAVKQCKRGIIPEVRENMSFKEMMKDIEKQNFDLVICPYEHEYGRSIKDALRDFSGRPEDLSKADTENIANQKSESRIAVIIGPEGGISDSEIEEIRSFGAEAVTLGKTILRTETAGMAALAMIMYELEL